MDIKMSSNEQRIRSIVQHYNHNKYWKYRQSLLDTKQGSRIGKLFRLFYIKRADAFNNASFGTHLGFGAQFAEPPQLPHGLNGIIVSHNAVVGKNVKIFHQVTIGEGRGGAPIIGDDVVIGAGSKIIGGVKIGNRVRIAAGCVIMTDIPDDAIVLPAQPQIITRCNKDGE
jgi:serine acetyltransferase